MPEERPIHLSRACYQALLSAYREARAQRSAPYPNSSELAQATLDKAVLTEDRRTLSLLEAHLPAFDPSRPGRPLRALFQGLLRRRQDQNRPLELYDLALALIAKASPTTSLQRRPSHLPALLPSYRRDLTLVPESDPPPKAPKAIPFHCPECCPSLGQKTAAKAARPKPSPKEEALNFLESLGGELTHADRFKSLDPAQGRNRVMDRIFEAMLLKHRPNPVLVGPSGVGKSTILEGLARRILNRDCPRRLRNHRIFRLDATLFRSQAGIIGRIEEFLEKLVDALEQVGPSFLAIDEIHLLAGTGAHKDDPKGAEQFIREHLSRGRLKILGTTTPGEFDRFLSEDRGLSSRIVKIPVEEPSFAVARRMVRAAAMRMEDHFETRIPPPLADKATSLCLQYATGKRMPLAAIDLLDWTMARAEAQGKDPDASILEEALAEVLGCEVAHIRQEGHAKILELEDSLRAKIKGQDFATVEAVAALKPYSAGLRDGQRPAATLLFCGPTGVGKTETARQISRSLFGSEDRLVRVPMADFTDRWASSRLLGSGPGYVGHEKGGWLVRRLRETPACVLLLDEFDRAHKAVRDLFLEAFDNARLVDSRGLEASLSHCIVILTSNLGAHRAKTPGFQKEASQNERERLLRLMKAELSPELVGRLDAIIPFEPLPEAALDEILDAKLRSLEGRLGLSPGRVELENDLRAEILRRGFAPATGARGLDEALERLVVRPLAAKVLEEGLPDDRQTLRLARAPLSK